MKRVISAVICIFLLLNGAGCAGKAVSAGKDIVNTDGAGEQNQTEAAEVKDETTELSDESDGNGAAETVTSENDTMRVTLESSLLSKELTLTVEFLEKAEAETENGEEDETGQTSSLGGGFGLELFVSLMGMDDFSKKYSEFEYSAISSSDSGNSIVCRFTKDIQKDIIQHYKDETADTVREWSGKLKYSGAEIDDRFKEIRILTDADTFDKNTMLLSDDGMIQDILYTCTMAGIYLGNIEKKAGILFADEQTGSILYEYNAEDRETAETEAMHSLDQSKDVTIEVNPDGTSTIYYYAKEKKGGYDLESLVKDMDLEHFYKMEEFSGYKYEIDGERYIAAVTCRDSVRDALAQYQLDRIDDIPENNENFRAEDSEPVYAGMEHSEDYSKINILTEDDGYIELTASLYPQAAEEAMRYYHYHQIMKGIPASERKDPEVDYVDIYTGEVIYTHEF